MNKFIYIIVALALFSCKPKKQDNRLILKSDLDSVSYAMGLNYGKMLETQRLDSVDGGIMVRALEDYFNDRARIDMNNAARVVNEYLFRLESGIAKELQENNKNWLEINGSRPGIETAESGLQYIIEAPGNDKRIEDNEVVNLIYKSVLTDGTPVESSADVPAEFRMDGLIPGLREGISMIGEGGKIKLYIPTELAYGPRPALNGKVPPFSILVFDVELESIGKNDD